MRQKLHVPADFPRFPMFLSLCSMIFSLFSMFLSLFSMLFHAFLPKSRAPNGFDVHLMLLRGSDSQSPA